MMPRVEFGKLGEEARVYAELICRDGRIRSSKPDPRKSPLHARAAYVWRMVAFYTSPDPKHHCLPVMASFDLWEQDWQNRHEVTRYLDTIVDQIVDAVYPTDWPGGIIRWGQAFGLIGRPIMREDGSIVYR